MLLFWGKRGICTSYSIRKFQILHNKILTVQGLLEVKSLFMNTQNPNYLLSLCPPPILLIKNWTHSICTALWKIWRSYLKDFTCHVHHKLKLFSFLNLVSSHIFAKSCSLYLKMTILMHLFPMSKYQYSTCFPFSLSDSLSLI